ncbi:hypothetical protein ACS5PN_11010 [Roseateles sp. NT4]|uniref:hypothetical protein n=1 Tax=Roseateles sp. NT4 TaxID=3453715 RepID=UPI003EEF4391
MAGASVSTPRAVFCGAITAIWAALCLLCMGVPTGGLLLASLLLWAGCALWIRGETPAQARRRLLILAAGLSFAAAIGLGWRLLSPPLISSRGNSENALGLPFLELMGRFLLAVVLPGILALVGLLQLLFAWLTGREPKLRRVPGSEVSRPASP